MARRTEEASGARFSPVCSRAHGPDLARRFLIHVRNLRQPAAYRDRDAGHFGNSQASLYPSRVTHGQPVWKTTRETLYPISRRSPSCRTDNQIDLFFRSPRRSRRARATCYSRTALERPDWPSERSIPIPNVDLSALGPAPSSAGRTSTYQMLLVFG